MEQTVCLLCGVQDERPLLRRAEPRHVVCRRCGLVYQNPRPTPSEILAYYQQGYWEDRGPVEAADPQAMSAASRERGAAIVAWASDLLRPGDLAVEIGCGHGEILTYVRDRLGCDALGVEPSVAQADAARRRFGLEIQTTDLDGVQLHQRRAKLLILSHVLEHFHHPRQALARCRELLADDGAIFIEVPNILCPHPRKRLSTWLAFEHMYYYSVGTLSRVLHGAGFDVARSQDATFVRLMARKRSQSSATQGHRDGFRNEYRRVLWALVRHDLKYWPAYAARRAAGLLGRSA